MARPDFYDLVVSAVESLTDDAVAVTFAVPAGLTDEFRFSPGQSLTIRHGDERRSYSICAAVGRPPRIGVREVAGGAVSGWLVHQVRPGDRVEVQPPRGAFSPDLAAGGHHVLIAAGSGITPVMSIASSLLAASPTATATVLYGNRRTDSVMFADEIADLKDSHPRRMRIVHVLSREPQEVELLTGRLDAAKLAVLLPELVEVAAIDGWWLCGPYALVTDAIELLTSLGVSANTLHRELFYVEDTAPPPVSHVDAAAGDGAEVTVVLDGRSTTVTVGHDATVLEAAQSIRPDLPFACKGGVCGTCRAKVTSGSVTMRRNFALEPAEVQAGFVLTCQALPVSATATVDYDL